MKKILQAFIILFSINFWTYTHAENKQASILNQDAGLTVILDWFINPSHAPLFVAKEKGFFREQGLDVNLIGPANPSDPPKLAAAGKADIAITYEPQFMEQVDQGLPLIRIGTLIGKPLDCLVVMKEGPIKNISDLKGKRIGYSAGSVSSIALKTMLEQNGLTLEDVEQVNVHYDLTQALLSGKVDAVTGVMRTFEVIQMALVNRSARIFLPENYNVPTYNELILVAKKSNIHDPRLRKFLIALTKGIEYLQQNPKETWLLFAKNHPELSDELNRQAWLVSIPYFPKNPALFNTQEWLKFAEYMHKNGLIKTVQPIGSYAIDLTKE